MHTIMTRGTRVSTGGVRTERGTLDLAHLSDKAEHQNHSEYEAGLGVLVDGVKGGHLGRTDL